MENHDLRVSARTARLLASDGDDDGPPWRFSGLAVAAGDILHMEDGTPVLFTAEELRNAAETQAEEPLTTDHPTDDNGTPQYPPPTDETVGKVQRAGWLESQQAVGYDATTHDEDVAEGVRAGTFDVSVHPTFTLGGSDPETGARIAENIEFRDLSVVSKGDSPSNTAEWGPSQALASYTATHDIGAELTADDSDTADAGADKKGLVQSAVHGTLQAVGLEPSAVDDPAADADSGMGDADPGGSDGSGSDSNTTDDSDTDMHDDTREQYVEFLTANAGFEEESVEAMDDDVLERTYELAAENAGSTDGAGDGGSTDSDPDDDPDDDVTTLADMTVDELGEALEEQGFVTQDNADDLVASVQEQRSKAEMVDEIIAASADYDEDDREALMASADKVVDREHDRVTGTQSSQLPGNAGLTAEMTPGTDSEADEDLDEYGTGAADY